MEETEMVLMEFSMRIFCIKTENPELSYDQCELLAREEIKEEIVFTDC